MGLRGPAPIPIETKRARGNPGKHRLPTDYPRARLTGKLHQHRDLDEGAKRWWKRLVPILQRQGILSDENFPVVAMICRIESRREAAQCELNQTGLSVEGADGQPMIHPLLRVAQACEDHLRRLYREVGITPSARGSISVVAEPKSNALDDALFA